MTKLNNPEISDYKIGETALPKSFYLNVNTIGFFVHGFKTTYSIHVPQ